MKKEDIKKIIIPQEWKLNIDKMLSEELLKANRYFAKINLKLSELIKDEFAKTPELFYRDLCKRWEWHNEFYEDLLEPALSLVIENSSFDLSPLQVKEMIEIYKTVSLVDQATLIVSAAIKSYIDSWIGNKKLGFLSEEEKLMLITPPEESFWIQYHIKHLQYILAKKTKSPKSTEIKNQLLKKYHANDELIFEGRMKKLIRYEKMSVNEIEAQIDEMKIKEDYKIRHFYFTLEHTRRKAIRDILIFDNVTEYEMLTSLVGISGFILRKKILHYLDETKIIKNKGGIYDFSDENILMGLSKLLKYREEVLHKKIKIYKQTGNTCGAVCLMMLLHYFDKSDLDSKTEQRLHIRNKSQYIEGNHFSGLAKEAGKNGLEVGLIHSEKEMFKNNETFSFDFFNLLLKEYKNYLNTAKQYGINVINGAEINCKMIKKYLQENYLIIIAGNFGQMFHSMIVNGYNQDGFMVVDPLCGREKMLTGREIDNFMSTSIGKWMIVLRKKQDNLNKLLENLDKFTKQSNKYLAGGNRKEGDIREKI